MDIAHALSTAKSFLSDDALQVFYAANLRAPLFTGFFTLSGFLFAVKSFLIINLKKEVYESPSYLKLLERHRTVNKSLTHYGPLLRLSGLLYTAVCLSFFTSVCQITIGLVKYNWSAIVCIAMSFITIVIVAMVLVIMRRNVVAWLRQLEIDSPSNKESKSS